MSAIHQKTVSQPVLTACVVFAVCAVMSVVATAVADESVTITIEAYQNGQWEELETMRKIEENKSLASRYIDDIWNGKNIADADEILADDFVDHSPAPGKTSDRDGLMQFVTESREVFPDGHYSIEDMVAEEDRVMIRGSFNGTHQENISNNEGSGREIEISWMLVLKIGDGKITERWMNSDNLGMMTQLGFNLVPSEQQEQR